MIIWGSKAREIKGTQGSFFCPGCMRDTTYVPIKIARYFTLYFIPLFPTETLAEHVHCTACKGDFRKDILFHSKEQIQAAVAPWRCSSCNNLNAANRVDCLACGVLRKEHDVERAV